MKKVYSKPDIELVDFSLSGSIAATCKFMGNYADGNSCGYEDNDWIFFSNMSICDIDPAEKGNEDFCYHVPTEDQSVFAS